MAFVDPDEKEEKFKDPDGMPTPKLFGRPTPPADPQEAIDYVRTHSFGSGIPRLGNEVGGSVTDLAARFLPPQGAAAVGFGANLLTQAIPSFLTSATPANVPAPSLLPGIPKWLMQSAVKPSTDDLLSGAADRAMRTMLDDSIAPSMSGWGLNDMTKVARTTAKLDDQVGQAIAGSPAQVSVPAVASRLNDNLGQAGMQVNPKTDVAAVENAWTEFLTNPLLAGKREIPVQLAHELKKGTYRALGGKSYGEVGSTSVEAQKALARGLREETMEAVPEIKDLLAKQAELMNVKDVAGMRALMEANKNPMGLAALRVDHPLSSVSFMADRWAWLKALAAIGLHKGATPQSIVPIGIAADSRNHPALLSP